MNPELAALVHACGEARTLKPLRRLPNKGMVDEVKLLDLAIRHKVTAPLHKFQKNHPDFLSPEAAGKLKIAVDHQRVHGLRLIEEWKKVTSCLEGAGFPVLSIKGPALSLQLYGNPWEREMTDLDFLVKTSRYGPVVRQMRPLGYSADVFFDSGITEEGERLYGRRCHHVCLQKTGTPLRVELHTRLWKNSPDAFTAPPRELFATKEILVWEGRNFSIPGRGYHLAYVLSHGASHAWCLLHWILDFTVFWNTAGEREFGEFLKVTEKLGLQGHLKVARKVAGTLFDLRPRGSLSPESLKKDTEGSDFALFCHRQLLQAGRNLHQFRYHFPLSIFIHRLSPSKSWVIKLLGEFLQPTVGDLETIKPREGFLFLYYILRPIFIFYRKLSRLFFKIGLIRKRD